jgi:DNA-binding NtrC family response regulator
LVEDDRRVRASIGSMLERAGFLYRAVDGAKAALSAIEEQEFDVVLSDVRMPHTSGIELVRSLVRLRPDVPVVLMTGFASVDSAVEAMRAGALDYITKPFKLDALKLILERALERRDLEAENARLRSIVDEGASLENMVGSSKAMRDIFAVVRRVADNTSSVLISGESGTGKECVARALHFAGNRASKPFVPINCAAIPEGLLESELFGHIRGAFTGAVREKRGLFAVADGGTVFLDEIGEMSPDLQVKLLRVLEDLDVRPVGGTETTRVDVRLVAATNMDLRSSVDSGRFRSDLYYRLNVIPIHVPPLRDRPEDIRVLAEHFARRAPGDGVEILPSAMDVMLGMPWPGNVRELSNVIERAIALGDGVLIQPEDLVEMDLDSGPDPGYFLRDALARGLNLREIGEVVIREALTLCEGNKARTAERLGISRRTLYRRPQAARSVSRPVPPSPSPGAGK